jgi:hypothetical protein
MGVGVGVTPSVRAASPAHDRPHFGQQSAAGGTELPQDAHTSAPDHAPGV